MRFWPTAMAMQGGHIGVHNGLACADAMAWGHGGMLHIVVAKTMWPRPWPIVLAHRMPNALPQMKNEL